MRGILGAGLLAVAAAASATDKAEEPVRFHASARVELDVAGVPRQVQANPQLPPFLQDMVEERVMQWRFEPPRVDGQAKAGVTHVFLDACAVPAPEGKMRIAMDYRSHGPAPADGTSYPMPPRYPISAVIAGQQGDFKLTLQVATDGRVQLLSLETLKGSKRPFERDIKKWVADMRYRPEEVDGTPVATQVSFAVTFSLGPDVGIKRMREEMREEVRRSPECVAAGAGGEPERPVVLDSPFKPITTS
ncbi:energy transducer TonB [Pseudoxanthomonas sp. PXM01]|uniref:energy transducer TonB n=1 Tax=Pseudoxanthomonas sp. PXM01 TaxID=2769295 RepID=UPI00177FB4B8|nr:energy transducer TonB [Pseudoxanthomonas sp. PXM01]MBD9470585.1 energy transducer TonB [Pseudoxanthomonas sp. PXM01]